jgi:hypothetical protein
MSCRRELGDTRRGIVGPDINPTGGEPVLATSPAPPVRLSTVRARSVEWLWPGWLPLGKFCVLDGDPGLGKSTVLLDLAARVSSDGRMPDGRQGLTGGVGLLSAEDGLEDTICPRLQAAGADLGRVGFLEEVGGDPVVLPRHLPQIEAWLRGQDARLLIIDPLTAYLDANLTSDQEVRRALHPLKAAAERCRCTVVALRHLTKRGAAKALYRGGGSIAIIAAARSGLLVAADPQDPAGRVLAHVKHNLAPRQPSLIYRLCEAPGGVCRVAWGGVTQLTGDDLLAPAADGREEPEDDEPTKLFEAIDFLKEWLAGGPRPVRECKEAGCQQGFSRRTVERAARTIGCELWYPSETDRGEYLWALPGARKQRRNG